MIQIAIRLLPGKGQIMRNRRRQRNGLGYLKSIDCNSATVTIAPLSTSTISLAKTDKMSQQANLEVTGDEHSPALQNRGRGRQRCRRQSRRLQ